MPQLHWTERGLRKMFPHLARALYEERTVWVEDGEYVGKAADGTVVAVGTLGYPEGADRYLQHNPEPKDW